MTKLETHAWWDFDHFYSSIFEIWKTYKRYGESVLEVDLKEGDEKFRPLFTESEKDDSLFRQNVCKYWRENYHFVAGSYEELFKIFSHFKQRGNKENSLSLLPETEEHSNTGRHQTYSIQKGFYDTIIVRSKEANLRNLILINHKEEKVLTICVTTKPKSFYDTIIISECKKSEVIIV